MPKGVSGIERFLFRTEIGALISIAVITAVTSSLERAFLTLDNFIVVLTIFAELGTVTAGVAFLMISGEFDVSVGAVFALVPLVFILLVNNGMDVLLGFLVAMCVGALVGYANSQLTLRLRIPSFIATLGTMYAIRGLLLVLTEGFPVDYEGPYHPLIYVLGGKVPGLGIRLSSVWSLLAIAVLALILDFTPYGNHVYAAGGNPVVARELGVNVERVKTINFIICSLLAGVAGMFTLDRLKTGDPLYGTGYELSAIAAAVIGGCSLKGGYGSIVGAALGALAIAALRCAFVLLGIPAYWYEALIGTILVFVALFNTHLSNLALKYR